MVNQLRQFYDFRYCMTTRIVLNTCIHNNTSLSQSQSSFKTLFKCKFETKKNYVEYVKKLDQDNETKEILSNCANACVNSICWKSLLQFNWFHAYECHFYSTQVRILQNNTSEMKYNYTPLT